MAMDILSKHTKPSHSGDSANSTNHMAGKNNVNALAHTACIMHSVIITKLAGFKNVPLIIRTDVLS